MNDLPAIAGGKPVKTTPYRKEPRYDESERRQVVEALDQGTLFYAHGKKVMELERAFAAKCGAAHAIATSSGTAAIHAALMAAGISPGDEVIVPPITDIGSVLPILWQGATPVFADLDPVTYNLDGKSVAPRITERTKAILAVHLAGTACEMSALRELAGARGVVLIEDCAQAHGCTYDGRAVGTFGRMGCYSFNEFKHISCGDGGIVITDDAALAARLRLCTDKGYSRAAGTTHRGTTFLANNYRMTELQGAVALAQLGRLDSIVQRRRSWCGRLSSALKDAPGLALTRVPVRCEPSWWFFMFRVEAERLGADADQFADALKAEGVPARAHYIGRCVYAYPLFLEHSAYARGTPHAFADHDYTDPRERCPVAEEILRTCVILPINESYSDDDLIDTVRAFARVIKWFARRR